MTVRVAVSTVSDGDMRIPGLPENATIIAHRAAFLLSCDMSLRSSTRLRISYDGTNFCRYREVTAADMGDGMQTSVSVPSDALITRTPGHSLFLPLADCVGAVIYDPIRCVLMLSHLGRHSIEQNGGYASVSYMIDKHQSDPASLLVWLSPSPGKDTYPMFAFDGRAIKDVAIEQLVLAGVIASNITNNSADTSTDPRYFSHSEFLKGNSAKNGRHSMAAVMIK